MKIGDLVSWYCPIDAMDGIVYHEEDLGIVTKIKQDPDDCQVYVMWQSGEGSGWFDDNNPSMGILSENR
jgi:hypothetical protein|tara:strand:+ start:336 stop:542 length:207 start_codon:yes stop_codon:yes gene_type:complete